MQPAHAPPSSIDLIRLPFTRSPQIGARLVSLKALPAVLRSALKSRGSAGATGLGSGGGHAPSSLNPVMAACSMYAAGLVGNLCNHVACQTVVATTRGLAQV